MAMVVITYFPPHCHDFQQAVSFEIQNVAAYPIQLITAKFLALSSNTGNTIGLW